MTHIGYIATAYGVTGVVLVAMAVWLLADGHRQVRRLAELDARGVRRRSAGR